MCLVSLTLELDQRTPDSQHLHRALTRYNETVQSLMGQTHVDGIPQQELTAFQEEFGPTAFVCNIRRCERATFGFSSKARLVDHQARHDGNLKCSVQGCAYNDVGFTTTKSLKDHHRNRHGAPKIKPVPKRFRYALHDDDDNGTLNVAPEEQHNVSNVAPEGQGSNHALQDYDMQLELLELQNKRKLLMARQKQDTLNVAPEGQGPNPLPQDYQMQLMLLEQEKKKRLLMARWEQDNISNVAPEGQGSNHALQDYDM